MNEQFIPLDLNSNLEVIKDIITNISSFLDKTNDMDNTQEKITSQTFLKIIEEYKSKKILYGSEIEDKIFLSYDKRIKIGINNNPCDVITIFNLLLDVFFTQNRADVYVPALKYEMTSEMLVNVLCRYAKFFAFGEHFFTINKMVNEEDFDIILETKDNVLKIKHKGKYENYNVNFLLKPYIIETKGDK